MIDLFLVKEALESVRIETGHTLTLRDYLIHQVETKARLERRARREARKAALSAP